MKTIAQQKNTEVQNAYEAWLKTEGYDLNDPLSVDKDHTITKFLEASGLKFEPVLTEIDALKLEQTTGGKHY